jgi:hypothetical protein
MQALLWIINPGAPDAFWKLMEGKDISNTESILADLIYSHKKGWITILGNTDKSADDIKSIIQEHFDVAIIRPKQLDSGSIPRRRVKPGLERRVRLR